MRRFASQIWENNLRIIHLVNASASVLNVKYFKHKTVKKTLLFSTKDLLCNQLLIGDFRFWSNLLQKTDAVYFENTLGSTGFAEGETKQKKHNLG